MGQFFHSAVGLAKFLIRQLWAASRCVAAGKGNEGAQHIRFALQALHDDIAMLIASRGTSVSMACSQNVDRVLIVKLDRIGDMVNTTPVFDFLRGKYPMARLDIVGHPAVLTLLDGDPRLGNRFPYKSVLYHGGSLLPPGLAAWRLVRKLRWARYPLVVYLRGSFPFLLLGLRSNFVTAKFVEGEPVIRRYLRPLGAPVGPQDPMPVPSLCVSAAVRGQVGGKYPHLMRQPYIVIHAVSGAVGKQWPLKRFAAVADEIAVRAQVQVLFLATPAEMGKLAEIQSLCSRSHLFETGFTLPEVVAAIADAAVFVGNDSGLAHIAASVATREVVIWGGANREMAQPVTAPGFCTVLYREVPCRQGCPEVRCVGPRDIGCLMDITESDVTNAALEQLRAAITSRH